MPSSISTPAAQTSGPTVIGTRGPMRADSEAARDDNNNKESVTGIPDNPACNAVQPTACSCSTVKSDTPPSAP